MPIKIADFEVRFADDSRADRCRAVILKEYRGAKPRCGMRAEPDSPLCVHHQRAVVRGSTVYVIGGEVRIKPRQLPFPGVQGI